ncbi:hypothetical protein VC83_00151 [Pseudogymnoascus destructans]|uniref:Uncharacterized protein n=1 Tax=Pseudogymnoascus destructans TaxID=655981 RepID=A0A177APP4_9PEZI|nr:uncharacterized protein VC83_00151 [Pseudogymnoascus destructans]OAF63361.1 hypothetical protein VC83_00151 [Pseudogymnoascus destructans]
MPPRPLRSRLKKRAHLFRAPIPRPSAPAVDSGGHNALGIQAGNHGDQPSDTSIQFNAMINGDASDDYDNDYDTIGSNSDSDIDMPLPQPQDLQEITEKAIQDLSGHIPVDDPATTVPYADTARNDVFVLEIPTEDFLPDDLRMPPPPIPAATEHASILGEDDSELVQHNRSSQPFSPYLAFMAMWAEKYNLSRQAYQGLNEGLPLGQDLNIKAVELPRDVTTLKKQFMAQLPLLPLQHKMVDLNQEKLPTMTPAEKTGPRKDRQADAHWFDVAMLVTAILSAEDLHKDFWKGLGAFVDTPNKIWECDVWLCSLRTMSGEHITFSDRLPVICSEFVEYNSKKKGGV